MIVINPWTFSIRIIDRIRGSCGVEFFDGQFREKSELSGRGFLTDCGHCRPTIATAKASFTFRSIVGDELYNPRSRGCIGDFWVRDKDEMTKTRYNSVDHDPDAFPAIGTKIYLTQEQFRQLGNNMALVNWSHRADISFECVGENLQPHDKYTDEPVFVIHENGSGLDVVKYNFHFDVFQAPVADQQ